jgi:hypothetical protein
MTELVKSENNLHPILCWMLDHIFSWLNQEGVDREADITSQSRKSISSGSSLRSVPSLLELGATAEDTWQDLYSVGPFHTQLPTYHVGILSNQHNVWPLGKLPTESSWLGRYTKLLVYYVFPYSGRCSS